MICGKILDGVLNDCNSAMISGIDDFIYIYNKSEVSFTYSSTDNNVITGLTLAAGASGHAFQGYNNAFTASDKMIITESGPRYEHEIDFKIFKNDAKTKSTIRAMAYGKFVVIVENLSRVGDAQFEVFGIAAGLIVGDSTRSTADENTSSGRVLKLTKPKGTRETAPPATFQVMLSGAYDYVTTRAALLATIPAPIGTSVVVEP